MIYLGLDDTDIIDSKGTNQIAKAITAKLADRLECVLILRHQLLDDPRVPYTSQNGSASILLKPIQAEWQSLPPQELCDVVFDLFRSELAIWFVEGSDPGLCITTEVPPEVILFGQHCQRELATQAEARQLADRHHIRLEGLGGTEDGVIGALAAIGLAATGNDGRVVKLGTWPDDLSGPQLVETLISRKVWIRDVESHQPIEQGTIDVGKHLRPNYREGQVVLFARGLDIETNSWEAVRLP